MDEGRLLVRTRAQGKDVSLHVIDNGPGIFREHLERIFDPFFTTKEPGEGTGLGLSLVHSIIAEHGGEIRVESEPGQGATFILDLPANTVTTPAPATKERGAGTARPLRVLVVDDEESVRRAVVRYLTRRGHEVREAGEGAEALRLVDQADSAYDVILSDLRMPGVSGGAFLAELRKRSGSSARLMVMTGDAASSDAADILEAMNVPVIIKPFELAELARMIESAEER
jgi:CheY-like chemotaxis protein